MRWTIIGLGNPGHKYHNTRHNIGMRSVDAFKDEYDLPDFEESEKLRGLTTSGTVDFQDVVLLKPTTFMNKSGVAAKEAVPTERAMEKLIVVHDDIDLPLGEIRISFNKSAGGHNGVASIIAALDTKGFTRVRIGIAPTDADENIKKPAQPQVRDYVLGSFDPDQRDKVEEKIIPRAVKAITAIIEQGREAAQNVVNS